MRAVVFALVLLAGCREEPDMLRGPEIAALLTQNRTIAFQRFSYGGTAQLRSDHRFDVTVPRLGQDSGMWWVEGDAICSRWHKFQQGQTLCAAIGQLPDGTYQGFSPTSGAYLGAFRLVN